MQHRDVTVAAQSLNAIIALLSSMIASRSLWGIHQHCRNHTLVSPCHIKSAYKAKEDLPPQSQVSPRLPSSTEHSNCPTKARILCLDSL